MNRKPFVGWFFYGTDTARRRANYFASYGLMDYLSPPVLSPSSSVSVMGGMSGSILGG